MTHMFLVFQQFRFWHLYDGQRERKIYILPELDEKNRISPLFDNFTEMQKIYDKSSRLFQKIDQKM